MWNDESEYRRGEDEQASKANNTELRSARTVMK